MKSKRERVRPVRTASIAAKTFRPLTRSSRHVELNADNAEIVVQDLHRGCLSSLNLYLAAHKGIPDRRVALELRKLLTGSHHRTDYRLLVVDHPSKPSSKGGRPTIEVPLPSENELAIAQQYYEVHVVERKGYLAREAVAKKLGISPSTVTRAIKKVKEAELNGALREERERRRETLKASREEALTALRGGPAGW